MAKFKSIKKLYKEMMDYNDKYKEQKWFHKEKEILMGNIFYKGQSLYRKYIC